MLPVRSCSVSVPHGIPFNAGGPTHFVPSGFLTVTQVPSHCISQARFWSQIRGLLFTYKLFSATGRFTEPNTDSGRASSKLSLTDRKLRAVLFAKLEGSTVWILLKGYYRI